MVISKEWIDKQIDFSLRNTMTVQEGVQYVVGIDYGRVHDASSICVTHYDKETKRIVLDYMRTISGEFDHETDYMGISNQLLEVLTFYKP